MPNWKKVITSGSNASLNQITASAFRFAGSGTAELEVDGHITASGNISASGAIKGGSLDINGGGSVSGDLVIGRHLSHDGDSDTQITFETNTISFKAGNTTHMGFTQAGGTQILTNITASGDISASGTGYFKDLYLTENTPSLTLDSSPATGDATIQFKEAGSNAFSISNIVAYNRFQIYNNYTNTNVFSITGSNVGIQTTTPPKTLTVQGDISASGNLYGSGSYLTIANDTTNPSELRLNCEANSHYIGIRGPVHSGASSYVLKLPNTAPSDNQILKVNGSPSGGEVTLAWEADDGGGGASFPTTDVVSSSNALFIGKTDGAFVSASTGTLEVSGSGRGQLEVDFRFFDTGSSHLSSDGGAIGDIVKFGGSSTTAGDIYYLLPAGTWDEAQADAVGTSTGSLAVALGTNSTTDGMLLRGMVKLDNDPSATIGNPVFLDDTAAGHARNDAPDTSGDVVRIVGHYYGNSGLIYFNPDNTFIEVA